MIERCFLVVGLRSEEDRDRFGFTEPPCFFKDGLNLAHTFCGDFLSRAFLKLWHLAEELGLTGVNLGMNDVNGSVPRALVEKLGENFITRCHDLFVTVELVGLHKIKATLEEFIVQRLKN